MNNSKKLLLLSTLLLAAMSTQAQDIQLDVKNHSGFPIQRLLAQGFTAQGTAAQSCFRAKESAFPPIANGESRTVTFELDDGCQNWQAYFYTAADESMFASGATTILFGTEQETDLLGKGYWSDKNNGLGYITSSLQQETASHYHLTVNNQTEAGMNAAKLRGDVVIINKTSHTLAIDAGYQYGFDNGFGLMGKTVIEPGDATKVAVFVLDPSDFDGFFYIGQYHADGFAADNNRAQIALDYDNEHQKSSIEQYYENSNYHISYSSQTWASKSTDAVNTVEITIEDKQ